MTSPSAYDVPPAHGAPSTPDAVPTWRDLPREPPYGPVLPPRTANVRSAAFAPVVVEEQASITPGQIALAVGAVVILVAIGIGAALLLLGDDDPAVADSAAVDAPAPPAEDPFAPATPPSQPLPDAPQGQLEPQQPGGQTDAPPTPESDPGAPPEGEDAPSAPLPAPPQPVPPGQEPPADGSEDVDLPRLFVLRTLPSGTTEDSTTVRQTTQEEEVVTEQTTTLTADVGEITVTATRSEDPDAALAEAMLADGAEEVSILGTPGYLVDGTRLVWVPQQRPDTLVVIEGPEGVGTNVLLTIAQGLELR